MGLLEKGFLIMRWETSDYLFSGDACLGVWSTRDRQEQCVIKFADMLFEKLREIQSFYENRIHQFDKSYVKQRKKDVID